MKKPSKKTGLKPILSDEDQKLWHQLSQDMEPLQKKKKKQTYFAPNEPQPALERAKPPKNNTETNASDLRSQQPAKTVPTAFDPPQNVDFDAKTRRRLRSGRIEISARLDLHGMRQGQARNALRKFLFNAHGRGHQWVLIITGKGVKLDSDKRHQPWLGGEKDERGVLRQNVPQWLSEPELRNIIVSFTTAGPRHGGDGALYVRLRTRRHA